VVESSGFDASLEKSTAMVLGWVIEKKAKRGFARWRGVRQQGLL